MSGKSPKKSVAELRANPRNPRKPWTDDQREWFRKSLQEFGDLSGIIENQRTGCLVGGHKRTEAFRNDPQARIVITERLDKPDAVGTIAYGFVESCGTRWSYRLVDWDEKKEMAANVAANKWSAEWDRDAELFLVRGLLDNDVNAGLVGYSGDELDNLLSKLEVQVSVESSGNDIEPYIARDLSPIYALREDAIFRSDLPFNIPPLRHDMLADVPVPPGCWIGGEPQDDYMLILYDHKRWPEDTRKAILFFYTDDYRFQSIWSDAVRIVNKIKAARFGAVIGPDFSMWRNDPLAVQIWNLYRSAWVARYWQEAGIKIIPSLNWSDKRTFDWCFAHIPRNAPIVACQCRTVDTLEERELFCEGLLRAIETLQPKSVWIYGEQKARKLVESRCLGYTFQWLETRTAAMRKLRSKEST